MNILSTTQILKFNKRDYSLLYNTYVPVSISHNCDSRPCCPCAQGPHPRSNETAHARLHEQDVQLSQHSSIQHSGSQVPLHDYFAQGKPHATIGQLTGFSQFTKNPV